MVRAAGAVLAHCELVIDAVGPECVAVKPQVACFEALGAPGWEALARVVEKAHTADLIVIADAKRGDVDVTAASYARAFFGETETPFGVVPSLQADAMTVSPHLGRDSLEPFATRARASGAGLFILARNSNPGAADIQELELLAGGTVSDAVAAIIDELGRDGVGSSGLSDIGAVVGATVPERLAHLRELMPHAIFLLPGVGAQGGRVEDLAPVFAAGRPAGLVSASRGIVFAHEREGGAPAISARREAARLRELSWRLSS
jgi:orotidine-5'-phosphate decarboxylase